MKKLVFAAFAAFVMVSVSNVFAGGSKAELGLNMPVDTTDSVDSTAHLFSSVMLMDSTSTDTTGTEAPAVV